MTRWIALPLVLPVLIGFWLFGCVSQHTYDTARMEVDELMPTLEATRT